MRSKTRLRRAAESAAGAVVLALLLYALAAAPGLVSDDDSLVPVRAREARR